jgi:hypothetical protein
MFEKKFKMMDNADNNSHRYCYMPETFRLRLKETPENVPGCKSVLIII